MNRTSDILLTDLRHLIKTLGEEGGENGPSIYDTAQMIRLAPPPEGSRQALNWLIEQQHPDGGWDDPAVPRARDVPTLAALLALHANGTRENDQKAVRAGLVFLRRQGIHWSGSLPDDLPVGIELLLPHLLKEAAKAGLKVLEEPYKALIALGERRRRLIAQRPLCAGTTPVHSWESLDLEPSPILIDGAGSIGHSPAATAAWLAATKDRHDFADLQDQARAYLRRAADATKMGIPGVVPAVWPINRFEQSFSLYMLLTAGLLDHPSLQDVIHPQLDELFDSMGHNGLGFSDFFIPDGDDTAAALAVLRAAGYQVNPSVLDSFSLGDHFCAFPGELQPSTSVTAHAIHALSLCGETSTCAQTYLIERQLADGRWHGDKWNGSWLYTTSQVLLSLRGSNHDAAIERAVDALLTYQQTDGSWGMRAATMEETAYAVLALRALRSDQVLSDAGCEALERAESWMLRSYRPFEHNGPACWLDKGAYRPQRLVQMIELAAMAPIGCPIDSEIDGRMRTKWLSRSV